MREHISEKPREAKVCPEMSSPRLSYRPEIDGLRAVSVLGVVLFHAGLGFTGGFVGVDVFFVISGFLITGIIHQDLHDGRFTLREFWVRRIRRILPAVSLMVMVVLLAAAWLLTPSDYEQLGSSSIAQSLLYANVHFLNDIGYFAEAAEHKPLLHTWTLAVEEQFYLVFPLLLVLLFRFLRRLLLPVVIAIALVSFASSQLLLDSRPDDCFYLLPMRAWELMVGSLLALLRHRLRMPAVLGEILSLAGLAMILAAMLGYDASTPFPGASALLPVIGAAAFIAGSTGTQPLAARWMTWKPMVFVGLLSYSLYLWHWPLFSLGRMVLIDLSLGVRLGLIAAAFLLSYASWRWVENPLRKGRLLATHRAAFLFGGGVLALMLVASFGIVRGEGLPGRFSGQELVLIEDAEWKGVEYQSEDHEPVWIGAERSSDSSAPDFVLWGDSHGLILADMLDRRAKAFGLSGEAHLASERLPVKGLWRPSWPEGRTGTHLEHGRDLVRSILDRGVKHVILIGRWSVNIEGHNGLQGRAGDEIWLPLVTNRAMDAKGPATRETSALALLQQLRAMTKRLGEAGVKVWLLEQVPEQGDIHVARRFFMAQRLPFLAAPEFVDGKAAHLQRQQRVKEIFAGLSAPGLTVLDPAAAFFDNPDGLLMLSSDRAHYRDDDHLTRYGAEKLVGPLFDPVFAEIADAR